MGNLCSCFRRCCPCFKSNKSDGKRRLKPIRIPPKTERVTTESEPDALETEEITTI